VVKPYIPEKGDLVILTFDPQAGHEQKGRRPALIISNRLFNEKVGLAFALPITNSDRDFPFHIFLQSEKLTGFIMTEQAKSIDYRARKIQFVEKIDKQQLEEVLSIIEAIIF
jgi:mRNA interferase MazF